MKPLSDCGIHFDKQIAQPLSVRQVKEILSWKFLSATERDGAKPLWLQWFTDCRITWSHDSYDRTAPAVLGFAVFMTKPSRIVYTVCKDGENLRLKKRALYFSLSNWALQAGYLTEVTSGSIPGKRVHIGNSPRQNLLSSNCNRYGALVQKKALRPRLGCSCFFAHNFFGTFPFRI